MFGWSVWLVSAVIIAPDAAAAGDEGQAPSMTDPQPPPDNGQPSLIVVDLPTMVPLTDECKAELKVVTEDEGRKKAIEDCDIEGKLTNSSLSALKDGDYKLAEEKMHDKYLKCAKLSQACADACAPTAIMDLRMMGAGVSTRCEENFKTVERHFNLKCEEGKNLKAVGDALNADPPSLGNAVEAMKNDLDVCSTLAPDAALEEGCAEQLAPVMLYELIMAAAQTQVAGGEISASPPGTAAAAADPQGDPKAGPKAKPQNREAGYKVLARELLSSAERGQLADVLDARKVAQQKTDAVLKKAITALPPVAAERLQGLLEQAFEGYAHNGYGDQAVGGNQFRGAGATHPAPQVLAEILSLIKVAKDQSAKRHEAVHRAQIEVAHRTLGRHG